MALWSTLTMFAVLFLVAVVTADGVGEPRREACYGDLGCFSTDWPYTNTPSLPASPDVLDTKFYLFSRSNPFIADRQLLDYSDRSTLSLSSFKMEKPVKVWIHGFTSAVGIDNFRDPISQAMAEVFKRDDVNYIIVDWSTGVQYPDYFAAVSNIRVVGAQLAKLITFLVNETGCSLDQFHLIGHSLGAHLAGEAGARLPGLARITGLDPAGPLFEIADPAARLDPNDATFVDVIHTDAEPSITLSFGLGWPIGHVDFYPNGGKNQPNCPEPIVDAITQFTSGNVDYDSLVEGAGCSHARSVEYWTESINSPCTFMAHRCDSYSKYERGECWDSSDGDYAAMGYDADNFPTARGVMFTTTYGDVPFCGTEFGVALTTRSWGSTVRGYVEVAIVGTDDNIDSTNLFSSETSFEARETYKNKFMSAANIGSVTELQLKFTGTGSTSSFWGSTSSRNKLRISRIDVLSNTGITISHCGDIELRSESTVSITSFNIC